MCVRESRLRSLLICIMAQIATRSPAASAVIFAYVNGVDGKKELCVVTVWGKNSLQTPGGLVGTKENPKETPEEAAYREAAEETGCSLVIEMMQVGKKVHVSEATLDDGRKVTSIFVHAGDIPEKTAAVIAACDVQQYGNRETTSVQMYPLVALLKSPKLYRPQRPTLFRGLFELSGLPKCLYDEVTMDDLVSAVEIQIAEKTKGAFLLKDMSIKQSSDEEVKASAPAVLPTPAMLPAVSRIPRCSTSVKYTTDRSTPVVSHEVTFSVFPAKKGCTWSVDGKVRGTVHVVTRDRDATPADMVVVVCNHAHYLVSDLIVDPTGKKLYSMRHC